MAAEKVLVADDAPEMRAFIVDVLRANGYTPLTAENGREGLDVARHAQPAAIIADLNMPEMSGLELAQALRRELTSTPLILITAEGSEDLLRQALKARVADFLVKPFTPDELLEALAHALELSQVHRDQMRMRLEIQKTNEALTQRLHELETLAGIGRRITAVLNLDEALMKVVEAAVRLTGAEESSLLLLDEHTQELSMRAAKNFDENFVRTFRVRAEDSLAGQVVRTAQPVLLDETAPQKIKTAYLVHTLIYVPLKVHNRVIGVLGVDNRHAGKPLTNYHLRLLEALADYTAIAIENARLYSESETERAQLETILRETEDGVVVTDVADRMIMMNFAAHSILGVEELDVAGRPLGDVIPQADVRALFAGKNGRGEIRLENERVFNAHVTSIAGVGRVLVMQDITSLKELDHIKSEFVTAVSHDLRSPLTAILGYVELLNRVGPVNEQQADFIRRIQFSVQSITGLITELLDLGRIEAGFDAQKEVTHLALVARYAVDSLRPQAEAKPVQLLVAVPENLPLVLGNPPRLRQMIGNLIENAIKYTPPAGTIKVAAHPDQEVIVITVSDSGMGIPVADQPYIFDKFYRASNSRDTYTGTGLGLSIVKSIVEDHGGRIWLESQPGQGTTFTVIVPQYKEK